MEKQEKKTRRAITILKKMNKMKGVTVPNVKAYY